MAYNVYHDPKDVMIGSAPFVVTLILMIVLLVLFPGIAMWLPNSVIG